MDIDSAHDISPAHSKAFSLHAKYQSKHTTASSEPFSPRFQVEGPVQTPSSDLMSSEKQLTVGGSAEDSPLEGGVLLWSRKCGNKKLNTDSSLEDLQVVPLQDRILSVGEVFLPDAVMAAPQPPRSLRFATPPGFRTGIHSQSANQTFLFNQAVKIFGKNTRHLDIICYASHVDFIVNEKTIEARVRNHIWQVPIREGNKESTKSLLLVSKAIDIPPSSYLVAVHGIPFMQALDPKTYDHITPFLVTKAGFSYTASPAQTSPKFDATYSHLQEVWIKKKSYKQAGINVYGSEVRMLVHLSYSPDWPVELALPTPVFNTAEIVPYWPGVIGVVLPNSIPTDLRLSYRGRYPYCTTKGCAAVAENQHTTSQCPRILCSVCHEKGHYARACPRPVPLRSTGVNESSVDSSSSPKSSQKCAKRRKGVAP